MNDIDKLPVKCRDCAYWELAREPYVCTDCESRMERLSDLSKPMPNNDYVKREDIFPAVTEIAKEIVFGNQDDDKVVDIINSIPAADVEGKRMEGIWIEQPESLNDRNDKIYRCSICGYADEQSPSAEVPYCWHCGSKMKREVK